MSALRTAERRPHRSSSRCAAHQVRTSRRHQARVVRDPGDAPNLATSRSVMRACAGTPSARRCAMVGTDRAFGAAENVPTLPASEAAVWMTTFPAPSRAGDLITSPTPSIVVYRTSVVPAAPAASLCTTGPMAPVPRTTRAPPATAPPPPKPPQRTFVLGASVVTVLLLAAALGVALWPMESTVIRELHRLEPTSSPAASLARSKKKVVARPVPARPAAKKAARPARVASR
jgi:hypothetical protein